MSSPNVCRVGFESFKTTFEYLYTHRKQCVLVKGTFDITSSVFEAYNSTVCELAETCRKTVNVGESFFACIRDAFCSNATDAVKAMGMVIYQTNKESAYNSAVETFPLAGAIAIGALATSVLIDKYATENKITKSASVLSKIVAGCSAVFAAHCYSVIQEGKI